MSRIEVDREDLMREATALRQRAQWLLPGETDTVIAGWRSDRSLSLYFGPDPCYHFDAEGRLRRAFVGGDLFRTQGHTLARLRRVRTGSATELQRHDLSDEERDDFLHALRKRLQSLCDALRDGEARCLRSVPTETDLTQPLIERLSSLLERPAQLAPAIRGKR